MSNSSLYIRDFYHNSTWGADEEKTYRAMQEYRIAMVLWKYFAPVILFVGTIGSVVSLLVLCQKSMRKQTTMFYLAVLGVADGMVLYVGLLRLWLEKAFGLFIRLESDWACRLHTFGAYVCLDFSVWILVAVSVDRCLFISLPYSAKRWCTLKRARITVVVIVLCMIVINVHFLWTYKRELDGASSITGNEEYRCYVNSDSNVSQRFIKSVWPWLDFCVYCLIPFVIMLGTNIVIVRHLIRSDRRMAAHRHTALSRPIGNGKGKNIETKDSTIANGDKIVSFNQSEDKVGADVNIANENRRQLQLNELNVKGEESNTMKSSPNSCTCFKEGRLGKCVVTLSIGRALKFVRLTKADRHLTGNIDVKQRRASNSKEVYSPWVKGKTAIAPARAKESGDSFDLESVSTQSDSNRPDDAKILTHNPPATREHLFKSFTCKNKIHPLQSKNMDPSGLGGYLSEEQSGISEKNQHGVPKTKTNLASRRQEGESQLKTVCSSHNQLKGSFGSMEKGENRLFKTGRYCFSAIQDVPSKINFLNQDESFDRHWEENTKHMEMHHVDSGQLASENKTVSQDNGISSSRVTSSVNENTEATSSGTSDYSSEAKHLNLATAMLSSTCTFININIGSNGFPIDEKQAIPEIRSEGLIVSSSVLLSGSSIQPQHLIRCHQKNRQLLHVRGKDTDSQYPNSYQHNTQSPNSNQHNNHSPHPIQYTSTDARSQLPHQCDTQSQNQSQSQSPNFKQLINTMSSSSNSLQTDAQFPNSTSDQLNTQSPNSNTKQIDTQSPEKRQPETLILQSPKHPAYPNRFTPAGHKQMKTIQSLGSNRYNTTSVSTTLLAVNVLFWIFNAPIMIYIIGFTYWIREADRHRLAKLELAWAIANILQYCNNAAHIFLYCLTGPRFRKELWSLLRRKE